MDEDTDIDQVVNLVDGLLEDSDIDLGDDDEESSTTDSKSKTNKLKIAYVKGDERSEGAAALDAMQDDLDEEDEGEEEEDQEILEMVGKALPDCTVTVDDLLCVHTGHSYVRVYSMFLLSMVCTYAHI